MNSVLKIAALLAGAYFILDYLMRRSEPATTTPAAGAAAAALPIRELVYQAAASANPGIQPLLLNFDQWNYYYNAVRGTSGPDWGAIYPSADPTERARRLSVDEWLTVAAQHGVSGLGWMRRSGQC
jgi:hypothetical protein